MPLPTETASVGLLLSADFMWISRITGTAQALGLKVKAARTLEKLEELAREQAPACVILDLEATPMPGDVIARLRAACSHAPRFVAYGSHVDVASLRAAREAGCDPVLPRSKLAEDLPALLKEWLS